MAVHETETDYNQRKKEEKRRGGQMWMLPLFLLLLLTTGIVGYILGRNTGSHLGEQPVDVIRLEPGGEQKNGSGTKPEGDRQTILHLTGRVIYTDGTPAVGRIMELHSEPKRTVTDSSGAFLFNNVPDGTHELLVINEDGSIAAQRRLELNRSADAKQVAIGMDDGGQYVVSLSVDVRMLEIAVELDSEELRIVPSAYTYVCSDGTVVTPSGSETTSKGPIVTPMGNVCLPDGTIIMPGGMETDPAAVIMPDDTVVWPEQGIQAGEADIAADGTVTLPDGTLVRPGGEIVTPDGSIRSPGDGGVVLTEEDVIPIGNNSSGTAGGSGPADRENEFAAPQGDAVSNGLPGPDGVQDPANGDEYQDQNATPKDEGEESGTGESVENGTGGSGENGTGGSGTSGGGSGDSSGSGGGGNHGRPQETTAVADTGELTVSGKGQGDSGYISWTQSGEINLFYDPVHGTEAVIAPGSAGQYLFRLENSRKEDLDVILTFSEEKKTHIPLQFTLTRTDADQNTTIEGSLEQGKELSMETTISGNAAASYCLDWRWPLTGNDKEDTEAGMKGGEYKLTLTVHSEGEQ